jgi:iron complex outermembrane receptor protein
LLAIAAPVLSLAPVVARAQTPDPDVIDLSPEDLKTVRVYTASMYLQSDREAPSAVTVVTGDQIRKCGYRTLADILNSVRGFYVSYDRNYSHAGVRGFSRPGDYNDRIQVLIDGHEINDNVYGQVLIGTEFPIDVDLISRVEIVRGPSSSLYGADAFFAVINVISKPAESVGGLELSADAAGFGSYRGRATYGATGHGMELLLSGTDYQSTGAPRLFFPSFDSTATNNGIAENADGDSAENLFANLKMGHFSLESVISTRLKNIPTASFGTVFNDSRTRTRDSRGYLDLLYNRTLGHEANVNVRLSYDAAGYHGVYADPPTTAQQTVVLNQDLERGDWLSLKANVTRTVWKRNKATIGVEVQDNLRQNQTNYNSSPYSLFLQDERSSTEWAAFVQDELTVAKGLIFNAGVRYDHYDTFGGTTNPRLALIFSPLKPTTLKVIYGQAFRPPNNYELYFGDGFSTEANHNLRPETIKSTEFIWEQSLGANSRLSASVFYNRIANLINQQTDPGNQLLVYENSGNVRSKGVELELAGKTRGGIEGRISYSFQRTGDATTGLYLTNSPPQILKVNIVWPVLRRRLSIGTEGRYLDPRNARTGMEAGRYFVANLTITTREFGGGFRLSASVYNLFNDKYSDPAGPEIADSVLKQNGVDFRVQISRVFHFR